MAIQVVCPGCKKRFQVSDKFAGKQGPCPSCKAVIKIPEKGEEVTILSPDSVAGTKGKTVTGQPTFKPVRRSHLTASPIVLVAIAGGVVVVLLAALFIRMGTTPEEPVGWPVLALGSILLAVPVAWGGYIFLRDPELASYRGMSLYMRIAICAAVYVVLWAAWGFILRPLWGFESGPPPEQIDLPFLVAIVPGMVLCGALAPFATFDLDYVTASFHYGFYLGICVLLRVIMHLPPF